MSQPDPANPYQPPPPAALQKLPPGGGMDYMRMVSYVWENPNWLMSVVFIALCNLIPIVGPIVVLGYVFEVVLALLANQGRAYPDFNFNRFVEYLTRGLWPFLVALAASLVFVPFFCLFGIAGAAAEDAQAIATVLGIVVQLLMLIVVPVLMVGMQPLMLRAGLAQDFVKAFDFEWIKDFLRRVWLEVVLGMLFLMAANMVLSCVGLLACCVGVLVVGPIISLAHANFLFQVYSLYLARGGTPIPVAISAMQPPAPPPGFPPKPM
jgi:hypothetical protein